MDSRLVLWVKPVFSLVLCVLSICVYALPPASTFNSVVNPHGNWTAGGSWSGSPSSNTCAPSGNDTYNIVSGDSVWTNCTNLSFTGGITINVKSGAVFYIGGNGAVTGNVILNVESGGTVIIVGNLSLGGNSEIVVDGELSVGGNVTGSGSYIFDCNGNSGSGVVKIAGAGCNVCTSGSAGQCTALPVQLSNFTAVYNSEKKSTLLSWETREELNNDYFEIEKSYDGFAFEKIGEVKGKGTVSQVNSYSFSDMKANYVGLNYYRLKQVDLNANFTYSSILTVDIGVNGILELEIYPNPSEDGEFNVMFNNPIGNVLMVLYDVHGNVLFSKTVTHEENGILTTKGMHTTLSKGIYFIQASSNGQLVNKKLMVK